MGPSSTNDAQKIEQLRARYKALETKKITAEANLQTSNQTLENLKRQAREKHGTDDLASLRVQLEEMNRENERMRAEYQQHLTSIETELAVVEAQHAAAALKETQQ
jgi:hypothetical protein